MSIQSKDIAKLAAEALEPCPFCNDPMEDRRGLVMHALRGDCIIASQSFPIEWAERWNRRVAAPVIPTETGQGFSGVKAAQSAILRIMAATEGNTNSATARDALSWCKTVAHTALDALSAIDIPAPAGGEEAVILDDTSLRARIGEVGNQVHNLACEHQNDEDLPGPLAAIRDELWKLAQMASPLPPVETGGEEAVAHLYGINGVTLRRHIENYIEPERSRGQASTPLFAHPAPDHHLRVEVERLRAERDEIAQRCRLAVADRIGLEVVLLEANDRATAAETRIADLEAAAKPFADFAEGFIPAFVDDMPLTKGSAFAKRQVTVGDFRALRSTLASSNKPVEAGR